MVLHITELKKVNYKLLDYHVWYNVNFLKFSNNKLCSQGSHGVHKHYLLERTQSVVIEEATFEAIDTKIGVPQGSVLGSFIFLIYTLPLAEVVKKHGLSYHFYADDSQLYM